MPKVDHALHLASNGFRIFPLSPNSKVPPKDLEWRKVATTDPDAIRAWWEAVPSYNIGVAAGAGTFIVDADTKDGKPGLESLEALEMCGLPTDSLRVATPSGGVHVYLRSDAPHRNSVDKMPEYRGIDIRADGGYVVGPGSTIDGATYEVVGTSTEVRPSPAWFDEYLVNLQPQHAPRTDTPVVELDQQRHIDQAIEYLVERAPEAIEGAGGDQTTFEVASACRDYGLSPEMTLDVMLEHWNEAKASPPWQPEDLAEKVANAYRYATGTWGGRSLEAELSAFGVVDIGEDDEPAVAPAAGNETWPDPVDLWAAFQPPELPQGLLPKVIEDFAIIQAELMGADPGGLAAAALAVCGAAIPDHIELRVKVHEEWTVQGRIWVGLVGVPSTLKSPMVKQAARALKVMNARLTKDYAARKAQWDAMKPDDRRAIPEPKKTRLLVEDTTPEATQEILKDSPDGILCLQDELSGWFGQMEKYSGSKGAAKDRAFWLQAFDGGAHSVDRISRNSIFIPNLSISMLGGIQPDAVRRILMDGIDDGLIQRFFPIVLRPGRLGRDEPAPDVAARYDAMIGLLREVQIQIEDDDELFEPGPMRFDAEAQSVWREVEERHFKLQAVESINPKLASHIGKLNGLFARLCVIWHAVENAASRYLPPRVPAATARRVSEFMRLFLLPHALAFYASTIGLSDRSDAVTSTAGFILAHPERKALSFRDLNRASRSMKPMDRYEGHRILEQLEFLGWLKMVGTTRNQVNPRWAVNPRVHDMFAERAKSESARRAAAREAIAAMAA